VAENLTLARPYAEAAFELARAGNSLEAWEQALERMAQVANDPQMQQCIGNPKFTAEKLAELFIDVCGKIADAPKNFVRILVDNERLPVLPEIHELFVRLKNSYEGVKQARVTSAFPLDDSALKKLVVELEPRFKCKLEATVEVDPELIGGVRVAVGDEVIDVSVRGKLAAMAAALRAQ
jgi:F-type H+-transporting ATPase subunit delta